MRFNSAEDRVQDNVQKICLILLAVLHVRNPKFLPAVCQEVKSMCNVIVWVCFSQLERTIHDRFVFKLGAC